MLTETMLIFQRQMRILLRNPVWVIFGLTQPILYLVLFGPLLKNVSGGGLGGDTAWRVFVPGLLLQLAIFGAGFAGFGIIQELREGVIDRQRVTPARRLSLIRCSPPAIRCRAASSKTTCRAGSRPTPISSPTRTAGM